MTKFAKIENNVGLVRDMESQAVLNTDDNALAAYKRSRQIRINSQINDETIKQEIDSIKQDIEQIKHLLLDFKKLTRN